MSQMKKLRLRAGGDLPEATRLLVRTPVFLSRRRGQWGLWFPLCGASGLTWSWVTCGTEPTGDGASLGPGPLPVPLADTQVSGAPSPPPCLRQPPSLSPRPRLLLPSD